jgi:hypothetical protein
MTILYGAVDRARVILGAEDTAAESPYRRYLVAKAVLHAAERGECTIARLSEAACVQWADASAQVRAASYAVH